MISKLFPGPSRPSPLQPPWQLLPTTFALISPNFCLDPPAVSLLQAFAFSLPSSRKALSLLFLQQTSVPSLGSSSNVTLSPAAPRLPLDSKALTKMSEPYSENNSAAFGRAHPGPQRLSRQKVHADIRPDRPPLGSGNQGVMYSRMAACGPCIRAAQRQPELWITSDTIFSPGKKIQFSEFVQHFMYHEVTVSRQQPRESLVPRLVLLSCSRRSFASHRASCSQSLTVSIVSKTWGKQLSVITVSLLGNLYF